MKKFSWLYAIVLISLVMAGCRKVDLVEPADTNSNNGSGVILMKTNDGLTSGDTVFVEYGKSIAFVAECVQPGVTINEYIWTLSDRSDSYHGKYLTVSNLPRPYAVVTITLTGSASNGTNYTTKKYLKMSWSTDKAVAVISSNLVSGNTYHVVMAFHKNGMRYSGTYFYTGSMTPENGGSTWRNIDIPAADTNCSVVNGALVRETSDRTGKYVTVDFNLTPGDYKMAVGKMVNGTSIWGDFWGEFVTLSDEKMILFTVKTDGTIQAGGQTIQPTDKPGEFGDEYVRFSASSTGDTITVFMNNGASFSSLPAPFINVSNTAINQGALSAYPNWGYYKIKSPSSMEFIYGPDINSPRVANTHIAESNFWDGFYRQLRVQFVFAPLKKNSGENCRILTGVKPLK